MKIETPVYLQQTTGYALRWFWYYRRVREDAVQDVLPDELPWLARQPKW